MRLRQIALVAEALEPVVDQLCRTLGLNVGFRDPGVAEFGLHNAVIPVGDCFLEVVSPRQEGTSAGRLLERRHGDGGYMVILQSEDLDLDRKRLAALGVRIVWEIALPDIATIHLHPKDVGGAILSLDVADPPSSWRWGGPEWEEKRRTDTTEWILGATIQAHDPAKVGRRWSAITGHPLIDEEGGHYAIPLDAGALRFVPLRDDRGDGLCEVELKVRDVETVLASARDCGLRTEAGAFEVCGTRIALTA